MVNRTRREKGRTGPYLYSSALLAPLWLLRAFHRHRRENPGFPFLLSTGYQAPPLVRPCLERELH
jgi:hypothetical protein